MITNKNHTLPNLTVPHHTVLYHNRTEPDLILLYLYPSITIIIFYKKPYPAKPDLIIHSRTSPYQTTHHLTSPHQTIFISSISFQIIYSKNKNIPYHTLPHRTSPDLTGPHRIILHRTIFNSIYFLQLLL